MEDFSDINKKIYTRLFIGGLICGLISIFFYFAELPEFFNPLFGRFFLTGCILMIIPAIIFVAIKLPRGKGVSERAAVFVLRTRNAFILSGVFVLTCILTYATSKDMSYFFLFLGCLSFITALGMHGIALFIRR